MFNEPRDRVRSLVDDALQQPESVRLDFLRRACGDDTAAFTQSADLLARSTSGTSDGDSSGRGSGETTDSVARARSHPRSSLAAGFRGTDRFVLGRRLGSGGFGVVHEARDLVKGITVALKSLQNVTSESLYRFKREFRSLADVSHPNLVQLYELGSNADQWFFTMELVNGRDFLDYVCGGVLPYSGRAARPRQSAAGMPASLDRLIPSLRQLVRGLDALHRSGHVHRDVKPSNVLVTADGRVVLLDFGLLMDLQHEATLQSLHIAGTPIYMSPEQGAGLPLTAASDFYSVGVMLYESLAGRPPFSGSFLQIVGEKQRTEPPPPSRIVECLPPQLDTLCHDLLRRDPSSRPGAEEILERLENQPWLATRVRVVRTRPREQPQQPFVGRTQQLAALQRAFDEMLTGTPTTAAIFGPSGIGKSVLAKIFLDGIRENHPDAVVLTGRCYERESVPYKALDSLVDALARYLKRLPVHEMRALLPRGTGALSQLFPVLRQFHERLPQRAAEPPDSQELRRQAYAALRELFARVGDQRPLVLFIDDLQWGDVDSAGLLSEVMRIPDAPVLLFIAAYRDVEAQTSPFLRTFLGPDAVSSQSFVSIPVDRLTAPEAQELAAALLGVRASSTTGIAAAIASEAGGSPFFIDELVRSAESAGDSGAETPVRRRTGDTDAREATLAHMIQLRLSRLPSEAQRLLHLVAVNGRPIPENVLKSAAYVPQSEPVLALLRSEHLVRARDTDRGIEFEAYHDRIRETVVANLDPSDLRDAHHRLAAAFETQKAVDSELLAEHLFAAGQSSRALHYTMLAAKEAERALAFDRAARLYRRSVELLEPSSVERASLMASLGNALTNAGRGAEAAAVYLSAPASTPVEAVDFKQKAAQQLLFGGHIDEGLAVIRDVLASIRMTLPESRRQILIALVAGRLRVRLRGLRYREREANAVAPKDLMTVDTCWSVSAGLSVVDTMRAAVFQTRHLLLALRAGEIQRVHRALCLEAAFTSAGGTRTLRRAQAINQITARLAERIGTPYARGLHLLISGIIDYLAGRWEPASVSLAEAERLFTDHCTGVTWELDSSRSFGVWTQYFRGQFKTFSARFPGLLKDAQDRGDLYAGTMIGGHLAHFVFLAAGDPVAAGRHTQEAIAKWSQTGFHMQHLWELWSFVDIAIYDKRGTSAWEKIYGLWPELERSLLLEVQLMRISMLDLRGRAAIAAAQESASPSERERRLKDALRCAKAIERQRAPWGAALALVLRAGVDHARGHKEAALRRLDGVQPTLETLGMHLIAAAVRRRCGELTGGSEGEALIAESESWMRAEEIRDPAAMAYMLSPLRSQST